MRELPPRLRRYEYTARDFAMVRKPNWKGWMWVFMCLALTSTGLLVWFSLRYGTGAQPVQPICNQWPIATTIECVGDCHG